MKKRVIVSIIITILVIVISNKSWLIFKPLPVSLDIDGKNNINIEVQLNKKDNDEFRKVKSEYTNINLSDTSHVDFFVNRSKYPKRLRFVLSNITDETPIIISNIQLKNGELKLSKLDKFKVEGAKKEIKNGKLILYPFKSNVTITYSDTLKIHTYITFEFRFFILIIVLVYLLTYKLLSYIVSFKVLQNKSYIEIWFLVIFFSVLFIPMLKINTNTDEISEQENRTLARLNPLIKDNNEINFNYGHEYDEWFNDRFFTRTEVLNIYKFINYNLTREYYTNGNFYINKKTNYMDINYVSNSPNIYNEDELKNISINVKKLQKFCQKNNIKLYILIGPAKYTIPNKSGTPIKREKSSKIYSSETKELIKKLEKETGQKIIYPYDEIFELSKHTFAFFKADHHWTDDAAYIAYLKIMNAIKKDFPDISISKPDDFNYEFSNLIRVEPNTGFFNGATYNALGLNDTKILDTKYRYFIPKNVNHIKLWTEEHHKNSYEYLRYINNSNIQAPNAVMFGDSTTLNLLPMLPTSFHKMTDIFTWVATANDTARCFHIKQYEQEILRNKPAVLIFCTSDIKRLQYLYKDDEN